MEISLKRVYEPYAAADGKRILVDRLWPRGTSKAQARIDLWARELAPSNELRKWYGHVHARWPEFRTRYFAELDMHRTAVEELINQIQDGQTTFLYSSKEQILNNAAALREYLQLREKQS